MKKKTTSSRGRRGASVGLVICFVAIVAMVGMYTFNNYQSKLEKDLAKVEEQTAKNEERAKEEEEELEQTSTEQIIPEMNETEQETAGEEQSGAGNTKEQQPTLEIEEESAALSSSSNVNFAPADNLLWPVEGNIILNYSMDKTVYFATLDQYKYNPAILISSEPGSEVIASAAGTVKSIEESAQLGTTLTLNIGNGYEIVYGQLKDIPFQKGDTVERGAVIGYLNEPSRYYSMEGCNLYYQVLKDGEPVNPMEYLEA